MMKPSSCSIGRPCHHVDSSGPAAACLLRACHPGEWPTTTAAKPAREQDRWPDGNGAYGRLVLMDVAGSWSLAGPSPSLANGWRVEAAAQWQSRKPRVGACAATSVLLDWPAGIWLAAAKESVV